MRDSGILGKSCDRGSNPRGANTNFFIFYVVTDSMELFMPSERILKEIEWVKDGQRVYFTHMAEASEYTLSGTIAGVNSTLVDTYDFQFELTDYKDSFLFRPAVRLVWEALENASVHGSKKGLPFTYGLFIARRGICHGFQDGDGYFTREDIKRLFESKTYLTEFDTDISSRRVGVKNYIYTLSDIIEVDTANGILYCAQYLERFNRMPKS